ncbi:MAG: UDP-4-amino-4,6-dideoxy-N-acetyl-beta-L-altrosamine transaminase [Candidatus Jacksonbacteria bacterium RIFOXYB2_FULL_44_15]|nr:MAG: hypothetical protein UW45_C0019G0004 [Parcubacteria group bacterium GW2011_GWC2_44_22]OGY74642.1 MAG: UDP-4-amino-4,6-dideoxy-N-acetyl-beta-L-altrosamine transaminase [Candidatus Jacksonbacteria bacterium RIFOXYA2_FULL_43_12]OGY75345.1 MAG: UDP-4-amino-4,6-dideoxy-N-acetyl-beta-L-altrosamine transaminase [Candidatus Jacksonbacteria bacterium RIFOXYB2_FULL_44_15]OGY82045.1 MAG: UDP-4-amino-4,6-dideoxy-N-acetyl-beta-L-altrosamine transaminase [Candidatus Jacksonbacteria bacterium RIFOXYD2_
MKKFLSYSLPSIGLEEIKAVNKVLKSGWLTMGPETKLFEQQFARYTGAKSAIVVNSCTGALHLSLLALGIGRGDEVITSVYTFAATINVIIQVGAKPVLVDIDKKTYNIDPSKIEAVITRKTRAIIPVHFAGQPCDQKKIAKIAKKNKLYIVEDAAHALGSEYQGKRIGTFGDTTCFSFYATKNITTGDGGAITTNNEKLADKIKTLRLHGFDKDAWKRYSDKGNWYYEIKDCGWKYNLTDLQSAIGICQLKKLDKLNAIRKKYALLYYHGLASIKGIELPFIDPNVKLNYHLYPILLTTYNRNKFITGMAQQGIGCSVHFIPAYLHPYYQKTLMIKAKSYPNAQWVYEREVSLPLYPKMKTEDVNYVIRTIKKVLQQ